jgi:hypothetical protein
MGLPAGNGVLDYRDRAILKTYLYRRATGYCLPLAYVGLSPGRRRGHSHY